jgi:hypothetical protein
MFENIQRGEKYSRPQLADIWGYASFHAIARGVVTPKDTNIIILFVTEEKQTFQEQYDNQLHRDQLSWEGPTDHFAEQRMIEAKKHGDEIHLFHRLRHHSDFTYVGLLEVLTYTLRTNKPSSFTFQVR